MPPIMPEIIPDISGAPEASAMPRQSGKATRKTTRAAGISYLRFFMMGVHIKNVNGGRRNQIRAQDVLPGEMG
ncbi:hypothetical protein D3C86_2196310 [compost metagenome]